MAVKFLINSLNGGGAETLTLQLAEALGGSTIILLEEIIDYPPGDAAIEILSSGLPSRGVRRYLNIMAQAKRLSQRVDADDHLVVSLFRSLLVAWLARSVYGMKATYDCWIHNDTLKYTAKPGVAFFYRRIFGGARRVVVNSKKAATDLVQHQLAAAEIIRTRYNFFDTAAVRLAAEKQSKSVNAPYLISLGRLHPSKNHDFVIRILAGIRKIIPELRLVIVGEGDERSRLEGLIIEEDLVDAVVLTGFVTNPYPLLKGAEALISCSASEGFGNVLVESLLCETPVMSTDIDSGPREILAPSSPDLSFRTTVPESTPFGKLMPAVRESFSAEEASVWVEELLELLRWEFPREEAKTNTLRFEKTEIINRWREDLAEKIHPLSP